VQESDDKRAYTARHDDQKPAGNEYSDVVDSSEDACEVVEDIFPARKLLNNCGETKV